MSSSDREGYTLCEVFEAVPPPGAQTLSPLPGHHREG